MASSLTIVKAAGNGGPLGLVVAAAALIAHAGSLGNGFAWDDAVIIVGNPALRLPPSDLLTGIDTARASEVTPFYRPLTLLSFLAEERLHGLAPLPMHLFNVLAHALCALLVYAMARRVAGDRKVGLLAGLLFAAHPLHVEAVSFLSGGRNTLLATAFALLAWLLHRRAVDRDAVAPAAGAAVLFAAGLLSKESAAPAIAFVLALEVPALRAAEEERRGRAVARLALYAAVIVPYLLLRSNALALAGVRTDLLPGLGGRLAGALWIVPRYLLSALWPPAIAPRYFLPEPTALAVGATALSWVAVLAAALWLARQGRPATRFGLAWFAAFLVPVLGIVPFPGAPLADRYAHAPAIGLWMVLADQGVRLVERRPRLRRPSLAVAGAVLAALAASSLLTSLHWRSDLTLFAWAVERSPGRAFAHHNLGTAHLDQAHDLDAAEREFQAALALDPAFPRLRTQLGYVRLQRGDLLGAIDHYREALRLDPGDAEALLNTAIASEGLGRWAAAAEHYRRFLATPPHLLPRARPEAAERLRRLPR